MENIGGERIHIVRGQGSRRRLRHRPPDVVEERRRVRPVTPDGDREPPLLGEGEGIPRHPAGERLVVGAFPPEAVALHALQPVEGLPALHAAAAGRQPFAVGADVDVPGGDPLRVGGLPEPETRQVGDLPERPFPRRPERFDLRLVQDPRHPRMEFRPGQGRNAAPRRRRIGPRRRRIGHRRRRIGHCRRRVGTRRSHPAGRRRRRPAAGVGRRGIRRAPDGQDDRRTGEGQRQRRGRAEPDHPEARRSVGSGLPGALRHPVRPLPKIAARPASGTERGPVVLPRLLSRRRTPRRRTPPARAGSG